jgi:hypothetical protein
MEPSSNWGSGGTTGGAVSKRILLRFTLTLIGLWSIPNFSVAADKEQAAAATQPSSGYHLVLKVHRDHLLPFEPLHVCLWLSNDSGQDGEISGIWDLHIDYEYREVGGKEWITFRSPDDPRILVAPQQQSFPTGATLTHSAWLPGNDRDPEKTRFKSGTKYEFCASIWDGRGSLRSVPIKIVVDEAKDKDAPALTELLQAPNLVADLLPHYEKDVPPELEQMQAFVKRHPNSVYSIYLRRSFVVMVRDNPKIPDVHAWAAESKHWLDVNAPWAAVDAQCTTRPTTQPSR